jgi:hypothetical protein
MKDIGDPLLHREYEQLVARTFSADSAGVDRRRGLRGIETGGRDDPTNAQKLARIRLPGKEALDILNERYGRGELSREEWGRLKIELATPA